MLVATVVVNIEGRRIGHIIDDEEPLPYPGAVEVHRLRQVFNLQYRWTMYAPSPPAYNGWSVCVGRVGSIYWFWEPDPEGYVQDARYTAKAERLTHF